MSNQCIEPPALDELELSLFADGEAETKTISHIATCAFCRAKAEEISSQQQALTSLLFRSTCPTPEEVRDYQMSLLDRSRDNFVALHVASCPHCSREVALLNAFLDDPLLQPTVGSPTLMGRLQTLIGELIQPQMDPTYSGIRGGEGIVQTFRVGNGQLGIEVQPDDERPNAHIVKGLVTGIEVSTLSVHLWQDEKLVATEPLDELLGDFLIRGMAAGEYELTLNGPDLVIRIPSLKIGA